MWYADHVWRERQRRGTLNLDELYDAKEINQVGEMSVDWMEILKSTSDELDMTVWTQEILLH